MGLARFWLSHLHLLPDRAAMVISTTSEPQRRMTLTHTPDRRSRGCGKAGMKGKEGGGSVRAIIGWPVIAHYNYPLRFP